MRDGTSNLPCSILIGSQLSESLPVSALADRKRVRNPNVQKNAVALILILLMVLARPFLKIKAMTAEVAKIRPTVVSGRQTVPFTEQSLCGDSVGSGGSGGIFLIL